MKILQQPITNNYRLKIGWLYPELMGTYGDRGNITVLQRRCEWRGINVETVNINQNTNVNILQDIDLLFGGGAQDKEQKIVIEDLNKKANTIKNLIEKKIPALFVCGSPQLLGKYYEPSEGKRIEGLGIFNMITKHPGRKQKRLIGNVVAKIQWENLDDKPSTTSRSQYIVGFENHGGRTYLGTGTKAFAKTIKGYGNNGEDGTEGVIYKNAIGSYFHGPLLPKNPEVADWLIKKALFVKYDKEVDLLPLDDTLEKKAKEVIASRLGIKL